LGQNATDGLACTRDQHLAKGGRECTKELVQLVESFAGLMMFVAIYLFRLHVFCFILFYFYSSFFVFPFY
jgi:hypothetical protein